jgi:hypothetical protein
MTKNKFRKIPKTNHYYNNANTAQASQNTSLTCKNLGLLQQKQPKISLKAHFFKNWFARKLDR